MALDINTILAAIAPDFSSSPSASAFISMATEETDSAYFGGFYNKAVALRAAHMWAMAKRGDAESGVMSARRLGPASVSFQSLGGSFATSSLSLTKYGQELLSLIQNAGIGASVCGVDEGADAIYNG